MRNIISIILVAWSFSLSAGLPPTSSKVNGEPTYKTTFNFDFGSFTGTRSGTSLTLSGIGAASGSSLVLGGTLGSSAILDVQSTTKGFLPPRMTTTEKNAISSPVAGLIVYDTTTNLVYFYTGSSWQTSNGVPSYYPVVPGVSSGSVDIFSFSFGTTNATTACSASPCSYLDQIGNAVSSVTRSSTGTYTANFTKTYTKLKCSITNSVKNTVNSAMTGGARCESCSSLDFDSVNSAASLADRALTLDCKGSY